MANKKIKAVVKLQIPGGKATPAPPVGSVLGPHGINIVGFTKEFNEKTKDKINTIIPVVITIYTDKTFEFIMKTPPVAVLIKEECNIEKGSNAPNKTKVSKITRESLEKIAKIKMPDLNASSLEAAVKMVSGSARSMGVVVEG